MDPQKKDPTFTEVMLKWHQDYVIGFAVFYSLVALFVLAVFVGLWQLWGIGPRRRRGLRAARRLLKTGDWNAALDQLDRKSVV